MSQFSPRVELAQEAKLSLNSKFGVLTVGTTATKLELTVGEPTSESQLMVCGDPNIASVVYLGLDNTVGGSNYFATLGPNEKIVFTLDSVSPPNIWAYGTNAGDKIALLKGL